MAHFMRAAPLPRLPTVLVLLTVATRLKRWSPAAATSAGGTQPPLDVASSLSCERVASGSDSGGGGRMG